jgi:hypothetical protein
MTGNVENRVRDGLDRLTTGVSAPAGLVARAVRQRRRRRTMARAGIASATAAVAAVAVFATAGMPRGGPAGGGPVRVQTAAYVTQRVTSALSPANTNTLIEQVSLRWKPMWLCGKRLPNEDNYTAWTYRGTPRKEYFYSSNGQLAWEYWLPSGVWANVGSQAWGTKLGTGGVVHANALSGQCAPAEDSQPVNLPVAVPVVNFNPAPSAIVRMIRQHWLVFAGYSRVDGQQVIKLADTKGATGLVLGLTLYVSPHSYLPVLAADPLGRESFRWTPATRANLDALAPDVPAGFRHVAKGAFGGGLTSPGYLPINPMASGLTTTPPPRG